MKTILVLTDFSDKADHAAHYALKLAQQTKAQLLLCNMFMVPYSEPMSTQVAWPMENFQTIEEDSKNELTQLAGRLNGKLDSELDEGDFRPIIEQCSKSGAIAHIFAELATNHQILMAVISQHKSSASNFVFEDHARSIIEKANFPVFVVPDYEPFKDFKKIAFATDLSISDIDVLHSLSGFAKLIDAEILVTHVDDQNSDDQEAKQSVKHYFNMDSSEIKSKNIFYRTIKSKSITTGLDWLADNENIDLLVLVHRKRNFFQRLLEGSVTHRMANHLTKPMLVFPNSKVLEVLPEF